MFFIFIDPDSKKPECLLRIEKLINRDITFINCDIVNINDLRNVFQKVMNIFNIQIDLQTYSCMKFKLKI